MANSSVPADLTFMGRSLSTREGRNLLGFVVFVPLWSLTVIGSLTAIVTAIFNDDDAWTAIAVLTCVVTVLLFVALFAYFFAADDLDSADDRQARKRLDDVHRNIQYAERRLDQLREAETKSLAQLATRFAQNLPQLEATHDGDT